MSETQERLLALDKEVKTVKNSLLGQSPRGMVTDTLELLESLMLCIHTMADKIEYLENKTNRANL